MIFLQAPSAGFEPGILFVIMGAFLIIQFVIIGPKQKKREKEMQTYVSNLTNGAKIVMTSGIHGKFLRVEDDCMVVEVDNGVKIRFDKNAVNFEATKALNPA